MTKKLANPNLFMNDQAVQVLKRLSKINLKTLPGYKDSEYVMIQTSAWYNGRERGFALTFHASTVTDSVNRDTPVIIERPNFIIAVSEARCSDSIVIDNWPVKYSPCNHPTIDDFNDDAYYNRRLYAPVGEYDTAVAIIVDLAAKWLAGEIKFDQERAEWKKQ